MEKFKSVLKEIVETLLISLIIVFICFKFLFISAQTEGSSMYPTLHDGDRGFSFVITRKIGIKRFDICVVDTDKTDKLLVKRIIGMPNETIVYKDNKLYVNGEYIEEDFLDDTITNDIAITLSNDEYYCLGDNRSNSKDSRYYGAFKAEEIVCTNYFVFFPFNRIGLK